MCLKIFYYVCTKEKFNKLETEKLKRRTSFFMDLTLKFFCTLQKITNKMFKKRNERIGNPQEKFKKFYKEIKFQSLIF